MKKILVLALALMVVASFSVPALVIADEVTTDVQVVSDGIAPLVKCKWEEGAVGGVNADTSSTSGLQIDQNPGFVGDDPATTEVETCATVLGTVEVCYYAIVSHDVNMELVSGVYADVFHPEVLKELNLSGGPDGSDPQQWCGSHKYQIELDMILENDNPAAVARFQAAYDAGLVTINPQTPGATVAEEVADIIEELLQGEAELYKGCEIICTHQPAGDYEVIVSAASGSAWSTPVSNILTVNDLNSFILDFTSINYGQVVVGYEKQIGGDDDMCTSPATVWNNGNVYINLTVAQDDAGFGFRSTSTGQVWNVHWAARLGDEQEGTKMTYDPNEAPVTLPELLVMCTPTKLDFFITVDKSPKTEIDPSYSGTMTIGSVIVPFTYCAGP